MTWFGIWRGVGGDLVGLFGALLFAIYCYILRWDVPIGQVLLPVAVFTF